MKIKNYKSMPPNTLYVESLITGGELRYNPDNGKYYADVNARCCWKEYNNKQEALFAAVEESRNRRANSLKI